MGTTEMIKALISPAEKLIDAVSGAIGKAYEPTHIRKVAEAKAYELKTISEAVRNNSDVPIVYNSTGVTIDTSEFEEIAKRASSRMAYQEITKQQNIEAVADNAYQELEDSDFVSAEPVDPDWMFQFFDSVGSISDEDMQKIWGHILAGEIKSPNSYSRRTLEKLRTLDKKEAETFQRISSFVLEEGDKKFLLDNNELLNENGIFFRDIFLLQECGLMSAQNLSLKFKVFSDRQMFLRNSEVVGFVRSGEEKEEKFVLNVYIFTESGAQLLSAIRQQSNSKYILQSIRHLSEKYKLLIFTAHKINSISDDRKIEYNL